MQKPVWLLYTNEDLIHKSKEIIKLINIKENMNVLDLGCGNGIMLSPYLEFTKNIYGVDKLYMNIQQCRVNLGAPRENFKVDYIEAFINKTDKKFDVIIIHGVIGYLNLHDQNVLLKKCMNKLNDNGYIILGAVNFYDDKYIFQTYPMKHTFIDEFCNKNNLTYKIYNDSDLELTPKYNGVTIILNRHNQDRY